MVGVKRPARETDRSSTKKLKVQDSTKSHPTPPDPTSSKKVPAQSLGSESVSEDTPSDSNLSAEEKGEDLKENTRGARSNGPRKGPRTDDGDANDILNGPYNTSLLKAKSQLTPFRLDVTRVSRKAKSARPRTEGGETKF
jgi:hypothetical protein